MSIDIEAARARHTEAMEFLTDQINGPGDLTVGLLKETCEVLAGSAADVPAALDALDRVLALHSPYRIYDECDCTQEQKDDDPDGTHVYALDIGTTCNLQYVICRECCCDGTDREYQTETCANWHHHTTDPGTRCTTIRAIEGEAP